MLPEQKYRVAVIGLGVNTNNYVDGLLLSPKLDVVVTCDRDENAVARHHFKAFPFVTNYKDIVNNYKVDVVFIVTPPGTHYEIAVFFLENNINVVVEKPPVIDLPDFYKIKAVAEAKGVNFATAYHWTFGPELLHLKALLPNFGRLIKADVRVFDPYAAGGRIERSRIHLGGTWLDSGSNALSALCFLFPGLVPEFRTKTMKLDPESGYPLFSEVCFAANDAQFKITIDWREDRNYKESFFTFENAIVHVPHSDQKIIVNDEVVAEFNDRPRLLNHYYHMLHDFSLSEIIAHSLNTATLHFLYEVNKDV